MSGNLPTQHTDTGQHSNMSDFGLMYYNARYYDPALGRFTSADTLIPEPGNPQSWDRYAYVENNPLRYTDPSGHFCVEIGGVITCSKDDDSRGYWRPRSFRQLSKEVYLAQPLTKMEVCGYRYLTPTGSWSHPGVDLSVDFPRVYALAEGVVMIARKCQGLSDACTLDENRRKNYGSSRSASNNLGYGFLVVVAYSLDVLPESLANDLLAIDPRTKYMVVVTSHYRQIAVKETQNLKKGMLLGYGGSTGYSTGPHLHLEVRLSDEVYFGACYLNSCPGIESLMRMQHIDPAILDQYYEPADFPNSQ